MQPLFFLLTLTASQTGWTTGDHCCRFMSLSHSHTNCSNDHQDSFTFYLNFWRGWRGTAAVLHPPHCQVLGQQDFCIFHFETRRPVWPVLVCSLYTLTMVLVLHDYIMVLHSTAWVLSVCHPHVISCQSHSIKRLLMLFVPWPVVVLPSSPHPTPPHPKHCTLLMLTIVSVQVFTLTLLHI